MWLRLPSVVLSSATVAVVYLLGRETVGRAAGAVAAAIMAFAPFAVYYDVEARPYASMTFFTCLSTLAVVRAVRTGNRWWWAGYVASAAAAIYCHHTCVFVIAVEVAWSVHRLRHRWRVPVSAAAAIVLLYVPWLSYVRGKALNVIGALYELTPGHVLVDLVRPIAGYPSPSTSLRAIPTIAGLIVFGVTVLAGLPRYARTRWGSGVRGFVPALDSPGTLILALALATPAGLLLYSLLFTDLWLPRGLSASMPAMALVSGMLVAALPRPAAFLSATAIVVVLVLGTARSFGPAYDRGPFRVVATQLDRSLTEPTDPAWIATYDGAGPIEIQLKRPHRLAGNPYFWRDIAPGRTGVVIIDRGFARYVHFTVAPPRGFRLVRASHYRYWATDVLTYERIAS